MTEMDNQINYIDKIKNILTFRSMSEKELNNLMAESKILIYEEDEPIILQGDMDQSFYAVIKGSVKVSALEPEGRNVYICTIGDGEVFGEAGIFMKVMRTANVTCCAPTSVLKVERSGMLKFIRENPTAGNKFLMVMIYGLLKKLKETNQELAYERKADVDQADIDALVNDLLN
jgi:CRP/FNR family transcriptional regulator, cyclic AMP receptor protein